MNRHFSDHVYIAQREERDYADLAKTLPSEIETHEERLSDLGKRASSSQDSPNQEEVEQLREELDQLTRESKETAEAAKKTTDPDRDKRVFEKSRQIRSRLSKLERSTGVEREKAGRTEEIDALVSEVMEVVTRFGSTLEKKELSILNRDLEKADGKDDARGLQKARSALDALRWRVLFKQDWFWKELFESMKKLNARFLNDVEAKKWISLGDTALRQGNSDGLREAVRQLMKLQTPRQAQSEQEKALRSGLSKF